MTKRPTNIGASVRARLLQLAKLRGEDFQLVLTRFANERLLYRLSISPHAKAFVLKGAALFAMWTEKPHRATRDLDFLGFGAVTVERIGEVLADILVLDTIDDGVTFDLGTLQIGPIREDREYGGIRAVFTARIAAAEVRLQIDIGVGDVITPDAIEVDYPTLLDFPSPHLRTYPRETVVAEKVEAIVQLGLANSRMKDYYDLVVLSRTFDFDGTTLATAIGATFARRLTTIPVEPPIGLTSAFIDDSGKASQWSAFLRKSAARERIDLRTAAIEIVAFVQPPLTAAARAQPFTLKWHERRWA